MNNNENHQPTTNDGDYFSYQENAYVADRDANTTNEIPPKTQKSDENGMYTLRADYNLKQPKTKSDSKNTTNKSSASTQSKSTSSKTKSAVKESDNDEATRKTTKGEAWKGSPDNTNVSTIRVLHAVNDNAIMAKETTDVVCRYVDNMEFADILKAQVNKYDEFARRAQILANKYNCVLTDNNKFGRNMAKMSIKMKMMVDSTTTKVAEMMLMGTTNGIIDLGKLIRHTPDVGEDALTLAKELLIYEEDKVELMKYHL